MILTNNIPLVKEIVLLTIKNELYNHHNSYTALIEIDNIFQNAIDNTINGWQSFNSNLITDDMQAQLRSILHTNFPMVKDIIQVLLTVEVCIIPVVQYILMIARMRI